MSDDAPILIRLGCAIDASVEKSFATIEQRAQKANEMIAKANERTAEQIAKNTRKTVTETEKAAAKQEAAATRLAARQEREAQRAARAAERAARDEARAADQAAKARARASEKAADAAERAFAREARAAEAAARREENARRRVVDRFATRTARRQSARSCPTRLSRAWLSALPASSHADSVSISHSVARSPATWNARPSRPRSRTRDFTNFDQAKSQARTTPASRHPSSRTKRKTSLSAPAWTRRTSCKVHAHSWASRAISINRESSWEI